MRRRILPMLALSLAALSTAFTGPASAEVGGFVAILDGASEVPGPGDADGFGYATVVADSSTGEVCVRLRVFDIDRASAAHIHRGAAGVAGPVVVTLAAPTSGRSSACVTASAATVQSIIDNPEGFYVNVHNAAFAAGAIRGQLQ